MSTATKLNYLLETKNQIKNAIQNKGVSISNTDSFRSYANKISQIETGSGGSTSTSDWQPEPDWFDIETILENDTEDYTSKAIFLLTNQLDDGATVNQIKGFEKYKLSDGQVIEQSKSSILNLDNLFDTTQDKSCSKGYKTRYVVGYSNSTTSMIIELPKNILFMILKNVKSNSAMFRDHMLLQAVKLKNFTRSVTNATNLFSNCYSLKKVEGLNTSHITDFSQMFYYCYALEEVPEINTSFGTNFSQMFYGCCSLKEVDIDTSSGINFQGVFSQCESLKRIVNLDIHNATNINNLFYFCKSLQELPALDTINVNQMANVFSSNGILINIAGITKIVANISINSKYLNHATLIRILNALSDQTGKDTLVLTIGSDNLLKLTDEEKAIATNKNWTLA